MACDFEERKMPPSASSFRVRVQEAQSSLNSLAQSFSQQLPWNLSETSGRRSATTPNCDDAAHLDANRENETTHDGDLRTQMKAWRQNPSWTDQPPFLKVSTPKGTLCQIESTFQVGIPPGAVYDIVTDPENKRVFKNIKEVTYRKVLEDKGHRQLVEVEQSAIWRFLCFSGLMSIHLYVNQNREAHSLNYRLAKKGFMKVFEGNWNVKPVYVDAPHCERLENPKEDPACCMSRLASEVHFRQTLQPIVVPPPPLSWYVRGISTRQTECLLEDLQAEAKRLREDIKQDYHPAYRKEESRSNSLKSEHEGIGVQDRPIPSRRKRRNIGWLQK